MFRRAGGVCECGCAKRIDEQRDHLDHFFGRAKAPETVENCWALSVECDQARTLNQPDAATWLRKFLRHACRHFTRAWAHDAEDRWLEAIDRALVKLAVLRQKGRA